MKQYVKELTGAAPPEGPAMKLTQICRNQKQKNGKKSGIGEIFISPGWKDF